MAGYDYADEITEEHDHASEDSYSGVANTRSSTSADLYGDSFANLSDWVDAYLPVCGNDVRQHDSLARLNACETWEEANKCFASNGDNMRDVRLFAPEVFVNSKGNESTPRNMADHRQGHRESMPCAEVPGGGTVTVRSIVTGNVKAYATTTGCPANEAGQSLARIASATKRGDPARQAEADRKARLDAMPSLPAGKKGSFPRKARKARLPGAIVT